MPHPKGPVRKADTARGALDCIERMRVACVEFVDYPAHMDIPRMVAFLAGLQREQETLFHYVSEFQRAEMTPAEIEAEFTNLVAKPEGALDYLSALGTLEDPGPVRAEGQYLLLGFIDVLRNGGYEYVDPPAGIVPSDGDPRLVLPGTVLNLQTARSERGLIRTEDFTAMRSIVTDFIATLALYG